MFRPIKLLVVLSALALPMICAAQETSGADAVDPGEAPSADSESIQQASPGPDEQDPPSDCKRTMGIFGAVAGVQTLFLGIAAAMDYAYIVKHADSSNEEDENQRIDNFFYMSVGFGYALSLGVSSLAAMGIAKNSEHYQYSRPILLLGTLGAGLVAMAISFASMTAVVENRNSTNVPVATVFGLGLTPVFIPAIGAALGYGLGKKKRSSSDNKGTDHAGGIALGRTKWVRWSLPSPIVFPSQGGKKGVFIGASLGHLSF